MYISKPPPTPQTDSLRFRWLISACLARRQASSPILPVTCCATSTALSWVQELTSDALDGDESTQRVLPIAVEHYLRVARQAGL